MTYVYDCCATFIAGQTLGCMWPLGHRWNMPAGPLPPGLTQSPWLWRQVRMFARGFPLHMRCLENKDTI